MKICVVGIGLIGGSLAMDIRSHYPDSICYGIDSNKNHIEQAISLNVIDKACEYEDLKDVDIVILSTPVGVAIQLATKVLDHIGSKTLVLDVGSTKLPICQAIANHKNRSNFLTMHPIAGTEFSGPTAAIFNLFQNKTNIICEVEKTSFKLQEFALEIFKKLGMRIRYMDAKSHDKHIAYVSHLSHISSFMLGKTVIAIEKDERDIFDMAGSGFESTVRLAKSSPSMWTPIFEQNKEHVIKSLHEYIANLTHFKNLIENDKFDEVYNEMQSANRIKEILEGMK